MRFATWNIAAGRSVSDGRIDLDRFAAAVARLDVDVLALQEVDRGQKRSGGADLTEVAADAMGAVDARFVPALYGTPGRRWTTAGDDEQDGPAYGCALVSRRPLENVDVVRMPAAPVVLPLWLPGIGIVPVREEPRVAIVAEIPLPWPDIPRLTVVGTHLAFTPLWKQRQLHQVVAAVRDRPDPLLVLGDLNLRGSAPARITGFRSLAAAPTYPAPRPKLQLDHVLLRGALDRPIVASTPAQTVSDHRPLVVELPD